VYRVFPSSRNNSASARRIQFRWVNIGDSREVVTPFVQVGTYPTRDFATLGPLWLRPPFTVASIGSFNFFFFTWQHWAGFRLYTSFCKFAGSCVFIKQSLPSVVCFLYFKFFYNWNSFSRSYRVILPSSFNIVLSNVLVLSTYSLESVLGTVFYSIVFSCISLVTFRRLNNL